MKHLEQIKSSFYPLQPSVKKYDKEVSYQEKASADVLQNFVYCYWQLNTRFNLSDPFIYKVVSDGCIDIFFNLNNTEESFVMGFARKYTEFPIGTSFNYIGIRFLPSAFTLLFGVDAKKLTDKYLWLHEVLPELSAWINSEIHSDLSFSQITSLLHTRLQEKLAHQNIKSDDRFFEALNYILEQKGHLEIESQLNTGLSPRQLRRIFNYYIGVSPKSFCKVIRFQYILRQESAHSNPNKDKCYFDVGYYDQAHFIKDFKTFYGITPSEAFQ